MVRAVCCPAIGKLWKASELHLVETPPHPPTHIDIKFAWICIILYTPMCIICGNRKLQKVCAVVTWPQGAFLVGTSAFAAECLIVETFTHAMHVRQQLETGWARSSCEKKKTLSGAIGKLGLWYVSWIHSWFTLLYFTSNQPDS